jgi:hypothetical protein
MALRAYHYRPLQAGAVVHIGEQAFMVLRESLTLLTITGRCGGP